MDIKIPSKFALSIVNKFLRDLSAYWHFKEDIYLDFSSLEYSYPFSMLVIGSGIRQLVSNRKKLGLNTYVINIDGRHDVHSYLSHIGFFDYINLPIGKKMGEAKGSRKYIPIKKLHKSTLIALTSPPYIMLRHVILNESKQLAKLILTDNSDNETERILSYCIREIIRNVFEHSRCDECYIFGQRWYDGSVEIAIIDEGIGIRKSLSEKYNISSDEEAIKLALEPGVSRIIKFDQDNINDNSGFGLYILKRIGDDFGWFTIGSGEFQLSLEKNKDFAYSTFFQGTYVGLHLNSIPENFSQKLDEIIHDGEVEAYIMGRNITASSSSREFF